MAFKRWGSWERVLEEHGEWSWHIKRTREADYSHPVLVLNGEVIDGMHRLVKAMIEKQETIPAKILTHLPDSALFKPQS